MANIVGYMRVSTKGQGESGLGLEAQQAAIAGYARQRGAMIAALYVEVESGKRADRPQLAKALAHARRSKATLVVAKLDRLAPQRRVSGPRDERRDGIRRLRQPGTRIG